MPNALANTVVALLNEFLPETQLKVIQAIHNSGSPQLATDICHLIGNCNPSELNKLIVNLSRMVKRGLLIKNGRVYSLPTGIETALLDLEDTDDRREGSERLSVSS